MTLRDDLRAALTQRAKEVAHQLAARTGDENAWRGMCHAVSLLPQQARGYTVRKLRSASAPHAAATKRNAAC
jgi:hypothetical protein